MKKPLEKLQAQSPVTIFHVPARFTYEEYPCLTQSFLAAR